MTQKNPYISVKNNKKKSHGFSFSFKVNRNLHKNDDLWYATVIK